MNSITDLKFVNSSTLLSSSTDGTIRCWNLESKSSLSMFQLIDVVQYNIFTSLEILNQEYFVAGSTNGKIYLWKLQIPEEASFIKEEETKSAQRVVKRYDYLAYGTIHKTPIVAL